MGLSEWNNYDYNGAIFVFGRIDSSLTTRWAEVTRVEMAVDSSTSSAFLYSADIKKIPYVQKVNIDGSTCDNNVSCKIFNINTYTHRKDASSKYQFNAGNHTCYLRFYYGTSYVSDSVSVVVHNSLSTPSISVDTDTGIVNVTRSTTTKSPRYYIEIRRKNRDIINSSIPWQDKDYIHTVVLKGTEGGKYNEGIPHTALMTRGVSNIAGSGIVGENDSSMSSSVAYSGTTDSAELTSNDDNIQLMSLSSSSPTTVYSNTNIPFTSGEEYHYYKFTSSTSGLYRFYQAEGDADLRCYLYSDSGYSEGIAGDDDSGVGRYFNLHYEMDKSETVYIEIYDYSRNGNNAVFKIDQIPTMSVSSFTSYEIEGASGNNEKIISFYSNSDGYITIYPANKSPDLYIYGDTEVWSPYGKTPYFVIRVVSGTNLIRIHNYSEDTVKFYVTTPHSDIDFQPYWRVNPVSSFRAAVIYDNEQIKSQYGELCMTQVKDALTRLSAIISETSGNSITFEIDDLGVSKLYVSEEIVATERSGRYINTSKNQIHSGTSKKLYYAKATQGTIYRVSYGHGDLYYSTSTSTYSTTYLISGSSSNLWYEDVGWGVGIDENTLVVHDKASSYYIVSNSPFTLEKVEGVSECSDLYNSTYSGDYNIVVRFGLDGTTWMGNQGIATSGGLLDGGCSADINGQGKWLNWLYYNSNYGVAWSYAIINIDTSDIFETLYHVIHEEIAQSLGIGNDCYSREESIHWDPEYANPDWYDGIDRTILDFSYAHDLNGYTQFDLCNEFDLPVLLFREYTDYNSTTKSYQFHLKDAAGNWLLRSGDYEIYAWCVGMGDGDSSVAGSSSDGWDNDPYSIRTAAYSLSIEGGWYWSDFGIDMKKGLNVSSIPYTVWNSFVDAVSEVMGEGNIPDNINNYGSAHGLPFAEGIQKAKATEDNKVLYAQRFNIVNYIISQKVDTGIGIQYSLTSQVLAEYMNKLQDCRNLM